MKYLHILYWKIYVINFHFEIVGLLSFPITYLCASVSYSRFLLHKYRVYQLNCFWHVILQISLWDGIIPSKEHAKFWIHTSNKYRFIDQVCHLHVVFLILFIFKPTLAVSWLERKLILFFSPLSEQGSNLRGKEFNLTLHWHVMPKTGKMFADQIVLPGYRLPEEYRWVSLCMLL